MVNQPVCSVPGPGAAQRPLRQPPVAALLGGLATVIGRFEEAESYFGEAAELNTRGEMQFAEAYTNLLWGRMLRTRRAG